MIYDLSLTSDPIRQGDIFLHIPFVVLDLSQGVSVLEEGDRPVSLTWEEVVRSEGDVAAVLGIDSVPAIVATQTCDAQREDYITLCQIVELSEIKAFASYKKKSTKNLARELITHNRKQPGIFYLPPHSDIGLTKRMAVVFPNTIRVPREGLEDFRADRKGRLNKIACEHFREKLSHFFHRYAWNEWYILNKKEIEEHPDYSTYLPHQLYDYQR